MNDEPLFEAGFARQQPDQAPGASRRWVAFAVWLAALVCASSAWAQGYPSRAVKIVVPFAAGSALDIAARMVADELRASFDQTFVVENKVGAAGRIGTEQVAKSPPDGYTLLLGSNTSHSANPFMFRQLGYDPVTDFAPIGGIMTLPVVVVVNPKTPVHTLQELIDYCRARPGKISYGYGNSIAQVTGAALSKAAGIDAVATPYKGSPQAMTDLLGQQIDFAVTDLASANSLVGSGKLRALAVSSGARTALMPQLPTFSETPVLAGFEIVAWMGLFAPAGTPPEIVNRVGAELRKALAKPAVRKRIAGFAADVTPFTPEQLGAFVNAQLASWGKRIKDAGITPE